MRYDFKNPVHWEELERQAYDGSITIDSFPPAAYRYFDRLRILYARYKYDNLSKEEAAEEKKKLLAQYKEAAGAYELFCRVYAERQQNILRSGQLLSRIEKAQSAEEIARAACECIGLMTGDASFAPRQFRKLGGQQ